MKSEREVGDRHPVLYLALYFCRRSVPTLGTHCSSPRLSRTELKEGEVPNEERGNPLESCSFIIDSSMKLDSCFTVDKFDCSYFCRSSKNVNWYLLWVFDKILLG